MNQIYEIAFKYYVDFYSYKGKLKNLWFWILLTVISGALFSYFAISDIMNLKSNTAKGLAFYFEMRWTFIFETIFLLLFCKLDDKKNDLAIKDTSGLPKKRKLALAKKQWINFTCDKIDNEFLGLAESIVKMKDIAIHSCEKSRNKNLGFFRFIYSNDSKARVTSYLIFIFSIFTLAALKDISSLSEVLLVFNNVAYQKFIILLMITALGFFFIAVGLIYFLRLLCIGIDTAWLVIIRSKSGSYKFVDIFVSDLIKLHRLPNLKANTGGGR